MTDNYKIVEYHNWCKTCKYKDIQENEDPCFDCMWEPVNLSTKKPIKYEGVTDKER